MAVVYLPMLGDTCSLPPSLFLSFLLVLVLAITLTLVLSLSRSLARSHLTLSTAGLFTYSKVTQPDK